MPKAIKEYEAQVKREGSQGGSSKPPTTSGGPKAIREYNPPANSQSKSSGK